jgi:tetratricopeptide (TPR) repeat protein
MPGILFSTRTLVGAVVALGAILLAGAANACDSSAIAAALDEAQRARTAGSFDQASRLVEQVLRSDSTNLRARYTKGLILIDQAEDDTHKQSYGPGLAMLVQVANGLGDYRELLPEQRNCPETPKLYTIFNTLGVEYYRAHRQDLAEHYYRQGEKSAAALNGTSRARLFTNMGILYKDQLNLTKAAAYFAKAQQAGSPGAATAAASVRYVQSLGSRSGSTPH